MHRFKLQFTKHHHAWLRRLIAIAVMVAATGTLLSQTVFAQNSYIITDGDNVTVYKSYSSDPDEVLDEVGIELSEEDTYTTAYTDGVNQITIQRMQMVTVLYQGTQNIIGTYGETVAALLDRMGIQLTAGDRLSCESSSLTYDGMTIEIVHRRSEIVEADEAIPFETSYFEDPTLAPDEEIILVAGVDGVKHTKSQVIYENGVEISRTILEETVQKQMVTQLVICGVDRIIMKQTAEPEPTPELTAKSKTEDAKETSRDDTAHNEKTESSTAPSSTSSDANRTFTTASGESYTYTDVLTCTATAYSCEGYTGHTASGTIARVGAIAVDPSVIPLGTKMYIVSNDGQYVYGYCIAEDTGGSIRGNKIDLYFDTVSECYQFGVRTCTVYILG